MTQKLNQQDAQEISNKQIIKLSAQVTALTEEVRVEKQRAASHKSRCKKLDIE